MRKQKLKGRGSCIPFSLAICSVVNNGFQASVNSPLASNFTSVPLLSLCFSGFLAKSDLVRVSLDPLWLPLSTSILRALRGDVAPLPLLIDEVVSSFSLSLFESFTGLSFFNLLVGSKVEPDVSTPKLSLTTSLLSLWYSTTTFGTSNTK